MPTNTVNELDIQVAPFFARFLQNQFESDDPDTPTPSPDTPTPTPTPPFPLPYTIKFPSDFEDY